MPEKTIELKCSACEKTFSRPYRKHKYNIKTYGEVYQPCCSTACTHSLRNKQKEVKCSYCNTIITKLACELKQEHVFCNRTCSAKFNNLKRKESGFYETLKSKSVLCVSCKKECKAYCNVDVNKFHCEKCKPKRKRIAPKYKGCKPHCCLLCNADISTATAHTKYCKACLPIAQQQAGLKSAATRKDIKRSKNEIYFNELCEKKYKKVTHNEPMFNKWDSDIQLHDYKLAIHWNGPWHYQYCGGKHSILQVQSRDKIKYKNIELCGWKNYIIKDMGKYNKQLVENEFEKLVKHTNSIDNIEKEEALNNVCFGI